MAGTLHHRLPLFLLIAFSIICSYAYSEIPQPPSALPPFHHNDKPLPWHNPSLPPHSHDKPSPIPVRKPPRHHMKPPASAPHPLDFAHPPSLTYKAHPPRVEKHQPPKPVHDRRHPSPPVKPHYPIKPPSYSPYFYKSPPPHIRHGGIYTAPPPIHH